MVVDQAVSAPRGSCWVTRTRVPAEISRDWGICTSIDQVTASENGFVAPKATAQGVPKVHADNAASIPA